MKAMDAINDLIMQAVTSPWLPLAMFLLAMIDGFFPPVPSESVLVAAAAVAVSAGGGANLVLLCAAAAVGAIAGDNIAYVLGRKVGTTRFRWMRRPRVASTFAWAQRTLDRHGAALIFTARYVPVGRVAVNMSAGALRYRWRRFFPLTVVAGITWSIYSVAIGLLAGRWLQDQPFWSALLGIAIAVAIGLMLDRVLSTRRARAEANRRAGQPPETHAEADSAP